MSGQRTIRVLHLEDSPHDAELIRSTLESEGLKCEVMQVKSRQAFESAVTNESFDIILSDYGLPGYNGFAALEFARARNPEIPFILVSGTLGEEQAVDSLKKGATDFVLKNRPGRLVQSVQRALHEVRERKEREIIERQLRLEAKISEDRFRTLVEQALVGIYVIQDDKFIYVNPGMGEILGYTPDEITSRPLLDFIAPEDRPLVSENIRKRIEGIVPKVHYTLHLLRRDQSVAFVEAQGGRFDFNGRPAIMGTLLDITERQRAEDKLREQAALLEKASDAILVCDLEGNITFWNKGAQQIYGWSESEAVGKKMLDLLSKDDSRQTLAAKQAALEKGEWTGELMHVTKEGKLVAVQSRWTSVLDKNEKPKSILVINTDITEKKQLEAQFLRSQRMESIGILAGGIAHDLNNVLTPILMVTHLLRLDNKNPQQLGWIDTVESSAKQGVDLIKQVLTFARGVEGERMELHLGHLIREIQNILQETLPRSIEIQTQVPKDLWVISGVATHLNQVLMNLCVNARDAMPSGGRIVIKAENLSVDEHYVHLHPDAKTGRYVVVSVMDTGCGIPAHLMEQIYDPFFTTKEIGKGTGLGLSTVKGILKSHGGFIHVYSEKGHGTSFKIYLPASAAAAPHEAEHHKPVLPTGNGECILFVDDESAVRHVAKAILERFGYKIITANNGAEGLAIFKERQKEIQLVLTDMMMPVMGGPEMIQALRKIAPDQKIIGLSGLLERDNIDAQLEGKEKISFIQKPFTTEQLLTTVSSLLKQKT